MGVVKKPCVGDQLCALDFLSVTFCSDSVQKLFCVPVCLSNRLVSNLNNKCTNSAGSESAVRVMDEATPGVSVYGKSSCGISRHVDSTKSVMFYTSWPTQVTSAEVPQWFTCHICQKKFTHSGHV